MTSILNALVHATAAVFADAGPATRTSTFTSTAFDTSGVDWEGELGIVQVVATVSGSTPTLDGKIQDSADGSSGWADVAGATFAQVTATGNAQKLTVHLNGVKRYLRYVGTIAGSTPSFAFGVVAVGIKKVG